MRRLVWAAAVLAVLCAEIAQAAYPNDGTAHLRQKYQHLAPAASAPPQNAPPLPVGSTRDFYAYNFASASYYTAPATLKAVGERCYFYVENSQLGTVPQEDIDSAVEAFDSSAAPDAADGIYQILTEALGPAPDIDGDPRVILLALDIGPGYGGYFSPLDATRQQYSNEAEMIYIGAEYLWSHAIIAHEFAHLLHWTFDINETRWVDEGLATLGERLCGYDVSWKTSNFQLSPPDSPLTYWPEGAPQTPYYGRAYLWMLYLYERHGGLATIQRIAQSDEDGMPSVDAALRETAGVTAAEAYLDWAAALYADDERLENGRYSFENEAVQLPPRTAFESYPTPDTTGTLRGWETHYIEFRAPVGTPGALRIFTDGAGMRSRLLLFEGGRLAGVRNVGAVNEFGNTIDRVAAALSYPTTQENGSETVDYSIRANVALADEERPTATVSGPSAVQRGQFEVQIAFSEEVVGFEREDIAAVNGSVVGFSGERADYQARIDPRGAGPVVVSVPENAAHDLAGNGNFASNEFSVPVRITTPILVISGTARSANGTPAADLEVSYQNETAGTDEIFADEPTYPGGGFTFTLLDFNGVASSGDSIALRAYDMSGGARQLIGQAQHVLTAEEARRSTISIDIVVSRTNHEGSVLAAAFSPDGSLLATGGADRVAHLWNIPSGVRAATLSGHEGSVAAVAFSPDGQTLATGSYDGFARLWDVQAGDLLFEAEAHDGFIYALAFSPDGSLLATGGADRAVHIWNADDGSLVKRITDPAGQVRAVAFSPDGSLLAAGGGDRVLRVWTSDGKRVWTNKKHARSIRSIAFSPDGETIVTGSSDETVRFWDADDGTMLHIVGGNTGIVSAVAVSPDGQTVAAANNDGTIALWAAGNGRRKQTLTGHEGTVYTAAYAPDGRTLASGSRDRSYRLWETVPLMLDVNGDDVVDIADIAAAAMEYGQTEQITADVNGDGIVDILDILLIADAMGAFGAPPAQASYAFQTRFRAEAERWTADADRLLIKGDAVKRGEAALTALLAGGRALPERAALLPNYPNPFNPETWIPFDLSEESRVRIVIYDSKGAVVRELDLGELPAGAYRTRSRAAYWDGRNALGEPAASGVYYVRIEAGAYSALRRMTLLK